MTLSYSYEFYFLFFLFSYPLMVPLLCCGFPDTRGHLLRKYGIHPDSQNNCTAHLLCHPCAVCQEARFVKGLKERGFWTGIWHKAWEGDGMGR